MVKRLPLGEAPDEVGYTQLDRFQANLAFELISKRYEKGSIITSNKSYGDWGSIVGDNVIAAAIVDLHHVQLESQVVV